MSWRLCKNAVSKGRVKEHIAVTVLLIFSISVFAADESPKKTFFLPKSPVAAAYVLGRLSNKELTEAPRSEFVYVALLQRAGLDRRYRLEALDGLAKARNSDTLTELITGINEVEKKGAETEPVLRDLGTLLLQTKTGDLARKREALEKVAEESESALGRQIGYAALITADASADKAWQKAESEPAKLADLLYAIPFVRDAGLRAALYLRVEPLIHKADAPEVRRAAIAAIVAIPGHELDTFGALAALVKTGAERAPAFASLQRISRKTWPKSEAEPLIGNLIDYLKGIPVEQRTEPGVVSAFQFATDLSSLLDPEKAKVVGKTLRGMGVSVFLIRTINEQMLYDKTLLVVEPGKPVEIVLQNEDAMPHNLVVGVPGSLEEIGTAAEKMPPEPDAEGRLYIPDSPKVLHGTKLVDPGQIVRLAFTAPTEPGDYPYLCTFPGHWRRMVGIMAVADDVDAYLANHAVQAPVTEWKIEDLAPDLEKFAVGRNLENGRDIFTKMACIQCHKLGSEGYAYGPDLTGVFKRYNNNRTEVLRQILEPSLVISNRYRSYQFELKNGDELFGMIVKEEPDALTIQTGPSDALMQKFSLADIKEKKPQNSSVMPVGLLYPLSKEQIYDLLAFIESDGKAPPHQHVH